MNLQDTVCPSVCLFLPLSAGQGPVSRFIFSLSGRPHSQQEGPEPTEVAWPCPLSGHTRASPGVSQPAPGPRLPGTFFSSVLLALSGNWNPGIRGRGTWGKPVKCPHLQGSSPAQPPSSHPLSPDTPLAQPGWGPSSVLPGILDVLGSSPGSLHCDCSLACFPNLPVSLLRARTGSDSSLHPQCLTPSKSSNDQ